MLFYDCGAENAENLFVLNVVYMYVFALWCGKTNQTYPNRQEIIFFILRQ